jgi:hypothetical protein
LWLLVTKTISNLGFSFANFLFKKSSLQKHLIRSSDFACYKTSGYGQLSRAKLVDLIYSDLAWLKQLGTVICYGFSKYQLVA